MLEALGEAGILSQVSAVRLETTYLVVRYAGRFDVKMKLNSDFGYDVRLMQSVRQQMELQSGEDVAGSIDLTQKSYGAVFSAAPDPQISP